MFEKIIWATDGSAAADRALESAKALARAGHGTLVVLHCKELFVGRASGYPVLADETELVEKIRKQADALHDEAPQASGIAGCKLQRQDAPKRNAHHCWALQPQPLGAASPGGFVLDAQRYCASLDGCPLELTPVEFRLLSTFLTHPGWVFSRSQLVETLYADFRVVSDRTVDSHIKNLRKKSRTIRPEPDVIRSVYGLGYKSEG